MSKGVYIRCYALDDRYWDDGIGFTIASDAIDKIDKYMEVSPWKVHPYQTFYIDELYDGLTVDITLPSEISD